MSVLEKLKMWFQKFMAGRRGPDELSMALLIAGVVLSMLSSIFRLPVLYWLSLALYFFSLFRMLSRNYAARRAENAKFLQVAGPALRWLRLRRTMLRDKEHRYFKCPNCGQQLRVPKGKGTITVTCRSCGVSFREKS